MNYNLVVILSFSIGIPAIIGLVRWKQISPGYYPFIILIWLGLINELISFLVTRKGYSNALNSNFYELAECILILLFKKNKLFTRRPSLFYGLLVFFIIAWCIDKLLLSGIGSFSSYFVILFSFVTVLLSISMINRLLLVENESLKRNSLFLICTGFIIFFTCIVLVEIFYLYGISSSKEFQVQVYRIMTFVNLGVNLLYAVAILWMPKKREYTLL